MASDGKRLEELVAYVEKVLVPAGFTVESNDKVYNDDNVQIAEFDIVVSGKLGTTEINWLIECRDRPSQGSAPGSWVEQLVGRRDRFKFNKVTAVSTTGFAAGVVDYAKASGIELREVAALDPENFKTWFEATSMTLFRRFTYLDSVQLEVDENLAADLKVEFEKKVLNHPGDAPLLRSVSTGQVARAADAFLTAVLGEKLFDDMVANGPDKTIRMLANYPADNDHFVVDTDAGSIRVLSIRFVGRLSLTTVDIPVQDSSVYRHVDSQNPIAQVVQFAPQQLLGQELAVVLHHITETGETHVSVRKVGEAPKPE